ncbi:MAG: RluA family pseudouridine synthase [Lachnospiraceae bacterium]|nr:RluA family pseudouridine synthase [Lachnospiraceae bacterium]
MQIFPVSRADSDQTLIKYLSRILPEAGSGFLFKQLRKKNIMLNDVKATGREKLKAGDEIKIYMTDETIATFSGKVSNSGINSSLVDVSGYMQAFDRFGQPSVIYEDDNILIFVKPSGVLSQKAKPEDLSANEWMIGYLLKTGSKTTESLSKFTPSICNRLDRNTAGLMLFGKTVFGANLLNRIIKDRSLQKYYRTVVFGRFDHEGNVESYLYKDERTNKVSLFDEPVPGASLISADFTLVKYNPDKDLSEVEILLHTGKSHQIRAQLSYLDHPVYGDRKYSGEQSRNKGHGSHILVAYKLLFPELPDYPELSEKEFSIDVGPYVNNLV